MSIYYYYLYIIRFYLDILVDDYVFYFDSKINLNSDLFTRGSIINKNINNF